MTCRLVVSELPDDTQRWTAAERELALQVLADIADTGPAPFSGWPADRSVVRALWLMISLQYGRAGVDGRSALVEIEQLAEVVGTTQRRSPRGCSRRSCSSQRRPRRAPRAPRPARSAR